MSKEIFDKGESITNFRFLGLLQNVVHRVLPSVTLDLNNLLCGPDSFPVKSTVPLLPCTE